MWDKRIFPLSFEENARRQCAFAKLENGSNTMKRRNLFVIISAVAVLCVAGYTVAAAVGDANLKDKDEVMKAEEARNQALPHGDVTALDHIYADDLIYTNATGALLTKAQHLADLKGRTLNFRSFQHDDFQVTVHGNTGIVTGISTSAVDYKGTVSNSPRRFVNVYAKQDGRWLCVAHMETPVKQ
jgi:ketosteroid isomerase-like protein